MDLFVYGTLMAADRLEQLIGRVPEGPDAAELQGYIKRDTRHGYPVILPGQGHEVVRGLIWRGIAPAERIALDEYEGLDEENPPYFLRQVQVRVQGRTEEVWAYIGNPHYWQEEDLL